MAVKHKEKEKMFIVRKYVMARDAASAIRKEKDCPVSDLFIDDDWRKNNTDNLASAIGFSIYTERDEDI